MSESNKVLWNQPQNLSDAEQTQARANINAAKNATATQSANGLMSSEDKTKLDGIEAGAEVNVQSDWNQTDNTADDYIKNKPANLVQDASYVHTDNNFTDSDKNKLDGIEAGAEVNVQADWNQTDNTADDYIKNKPSIPAAQVQSDWNQTDNTQVDYIKNKPSNLVQDASYVHTDNNFSNSDKNKLDGIEAGAEVNVQPDWNQTNTSADDYIKNKPNIPAAQVQSDWSQSDNTQVDFIKNKPANLVQDASYVHTDNNFSNSDKNKLDGIASGAEVNVQADWNQTDNTKDDYIKNKPSIPAAQVQSDWTAASGMAKILNKPEIGFKSYGAQSITEATSLVVDGDEPSGITDIKVNGGSKGSLISGPYKTLLDSGLDGLGDSSEGLYIDSDGTFKKCTKNVVYVGLDTPYADVLAHVNANREVILRVWPTVDNPLFQDFRLMQYNPDGSMEFSCVTSGYGTIFTYKYMLYSNGVWQRTNTSATTYQGILIEGIGRNLHLNQNNQVQTNLPGGVFDAPVSAGNNFERLSGADFAGAYMLACRHNVSGTYEIAIAYTASGTSSTYWFLGTETIVATDNTVTTKQAVYNATAYYTPSNRFGGTQSTAFDPNSHKAIIYNGIGLIGPCSDCKIVIYNNNGTVKLAFTAIEVGKIGATN